MKSFIHNKTKLLASKLPHDSYEEKIKLHMEWFCTIGIEDEFRYTVGKTRHHVTWTTKQPKNHYFGKNAN